MTEISYEYTTGTCDVWQLGHIVTVQITERINREAVQG